MMKKKNGSKIDKRLAEWPRKRENKLTILEMKGDIIDYTDTKVD